LGSDLRLVVGLGNPGPRYERNRHSVGFMVVDALAAVDASFAWERSSRFESAIAKGWLDGKPTVLLKPMTFMNLSGRAVAPAARFYDIEAERILVVHDDVDLELGRLKLKRGGGDGGHKGVRSIAQELGTKEFYRVRLGVGRPEVGDVSSHVLSDFSDEEQGPLREKIDKARDAARTILEVGLAEAMNRFHGAVE
jgi:peptidyl-tRNA hydrolase, PTH1 family